jgi:uncharacterized protein
MNDPKLLAAKIIGPIFVALILCGSNCAADDPADQTELASAVEAKEFAAANLLLQLGVDVNVAQADGMSALHWSIQYGESGLAKALIDKGARVDVKNRYGVTPLYLACLNANDELVKLLVTAGADPNTTLPNGETVLMTAARTGRVAPVKTLIAAGADVNAREQRRQTALMWAAGDGNGDVLDALIEAGADVDATLQSGFNALFFAVREGHIEAVRRLLKAGCNVNSVMNTQSSMKFCRGRLSLTPLSLAVENGHFELGSVLIEAGADVNARPSGYTALHALTWVRKPIRGDGDPSPRGSGKLTSLAMAELLAKSGADLNARLENGKSELGRFTYSGATAFLLAAQANDLVFARLLVQLGADPTIATVDGTSPLLAACGVGALGDGDESAGTEEEAVAMVEYLLGLGANINLVDYNGETVMHGAAYQSLPDLIHLLNTRGAKLDVWNRENRAGWTPLAIATGYRPGNFRPSPPTIAQIQCVMQQAGAQLPNAVARKEHLRSWSTTRNEDRAWVIRNVEYAVVESKQLILDLHFPQQVKDAPVIVWVHGGAWRGGSKDDMPLDRIVHAGYCVASIDYRLSTEARFPAQIHDIKAAIRFLRHLAPTYVYRTDRMAISGSSAGGHLAALVGTTNDHAELEGRVGNYLKESSAVHAIVDLFGPTNLMTIIEQSTPHGLSVRKPALELLLGSLPDSVPELARLASPVEHVDANDPPLLMIHGDMDPQVPIDQSYELKGKYEQHNLPIEFEVIQGGAHGGEKFFDAARQELIKRFLDTHLSVQ